MNAEYCGEWLAGYLASYVHGDMLRGEFSEISSQLNALPPFRKEHVKQIVTTWSHTLYISHTYVCTYMYYTIEKFAWLCNNGGSLHL